MDQISMPFAEKLDEPLADLCNDGRGLSQSERFAVVIRCEQDSVDSVAEMVLRLGGTIRHRLTLLSAVSAWVPLAQMGQLAKESQINHIELARRFTIAQF